MAKSSEQSNRGGIPLPCNKCPVYRIDQPKKNPTACTNYDKNTDLQWADNKTLINGHMTPIWL